MFNSANSVIKGKSAFTFEELITLTLNNLITKFRNMFF